MKHANIVVRYAFLCWVLVLGENVMAIEEPQFRVEFQKEHYEVRSYDPIIVAETVVKTDFDEAGNRAFRILADYIFGNNEVKVVAPKGPQTEENSPEPISSKKIPMTAPVLSSEKVSATTPSPVSQKIAMTAPVSQVPSSDGFRVQFTMPKEFTLDTLPKPKDPRVEIKQLPARRIAVFSYSGSWSKERYEEKLSEFKSYLAADGVQVVGEPIFARFDSPFRLWFLRRNEIWLEVKK